MKTYRVTYDRGAAILVNAGDENDAQWRGVNLAQESQTVVKVEPYLTDAPKPRGHTPGPGCGCCLVPVDDETEASDLCSEATGASDGVGWKIQYCPLHASAPDLLAACKYAYAQIKQDNDEREVPEKYRGTEREVLAAIAKATGKDQPEAGNPATIVKGEFPCGTCDRQGSDSAYDTTCKSCHLDGYASHYEPRVAAFAKNCTCLYRDEPRIDA